MKKVIPVVLIALAALVPSLIVATPPAVQNYAVLANTNRDLVLPNALHELSISNQTGVGESKLWLSGLYPQFNFYAANGATNSKWWQMYVSPSSFEWFPMNDDGTPGREFMQVARSSNSVSSTLIQSSNTIHVGNLQVVGNLVVTNSPASGKTLKSDSSGNFTPGLLSVADLSDGGTLATTNNLLNTSNALQIQISTNGANILMTSNAQISTAANLLTVSNGLTVVSNAQTIVSNGLTVVSNGLTIVSNTVTTNVALLNAGTNTLSGKIVANAFAGDGSGLTGISASATNVDGTNITGTIPDARLSPNVALLNTAQTFSTHKIFGGVNTNGAHFLSEDFTNFIRGYTLGLALGNNENGTNEEHIEIYRGITPLMAGMTLSGGIPWAGINVLSITSSNLNVTNTLRGTGATNLVQSMVQPGSGMTITTNADRTLALNASGGAVTSNFYTFSSSVSISSNSIPDTTAIYTIMDSTNDYLLGDIEVIGERLGTNLFDFMLRIDGHAHTDLAPDLCAFQGACANNGTAPITFHLETDGAGHFRLGFKPMDEGGNSSLNYYPYNLKVICNNTNLPALALTGTNLTTLSNPPFLFTPTAREIAANDLAGSQIHLFDGNGNKATVVSAPTGNVGEGVLIGHVDGELSPINFSGTQLTLTSDGIIGGNIWGGGNFALTNGGFSVTDSGYGSLATNHTLAMAATGITNTLAVNYTFYGVTGTSIVQTNASGYGFSRGTITAPIDITLQPGAFLRGSSCAATGGQSW